MNIDASQYQKIVEAAFGGADAHALSAGDAELIIAIAQLAIAADRFDDPDEQSFFDQVAALVYRHANVETTAPTLPAIPDEDQRIDHLRSHAAQLAGKPSASLAFALAYALVISDMDVAPAEGALLDTLREALGLDEDRANDLSSAVGMAVTPE